MVKKTKIPNGYRMTDVGVIPEKWEIDLIQNVCKITTGNKNTEDKVEGGNYPFFVRSQTVERINSYSFDGEGVLTAGDGVGTGKVHHYINGKFDYHQRVYLMSKFKENINGFFFFQYFKNNFYNRILQMTAKSSVDSVRKNMIALMQIPIPTKIEQTAIGEALSDMDTLIVAQEKLIEKKKMIKQGTMQELLKPEVGWERKNLGELAQVKDGTHQTPKYVDIGIPFYSVENITANDFKNTKFISEKEHKELTKSFKIEKGDVLMTRIGSIGVCKLIDWDIDASFYVSLCLLKFNSLISSNYFTQYSKSQNFKKEVNSNALLFAYPQKINLGEINKVNIIFPKSLEDQKTIAQILTDLDSEIDQLEKQLEKYIQIKTGMMQELLTGRKRLV